MVLFAHILKKDALRCHCAAHSAVSLTKHTFMLFLWLEGIVISLRLITQEDIQRILNLVFKNVTPLKTSNFSPIPQNFFSRFKQGEFVQWFQKGQWEWQWTKFIYFTHQRKAFNRPLLEECTQEAWAKFHPMRFLFLTKGSYVELLLISFVPVNDSSLFCPLSFYDWNG